MTLYLGTTPIANTGYDRASLSLANVNDAGQILMSSMGMPSDTYTDLTLGSSGSSYTAPANGWVHIRGNVASGGYFAIYSSNYIFGIKSVPETDNGVAAVCLPVVSGDTFYVTYKNLNSTTAFRFIYAVGSESEAS